MAKVIKHFFCIQEKKVYEVGDEYTGKRTDIDHLLEPVKEKKKVSPVSKNKVRTTPKDKK